MCRIVNGFCFNIQAEPMVLRSTQHLVLARMTVASTVLVELSVWCSGSAFAPKGFVHLHKPTANINSKCGVWQRPVEPVRVQELRLCVAHISTCQLISQEPGAFAQSTRVKKHADFTCKLKLSSTLMSVSCSACQNRVWRLRPVPIHSSTCIQGSGTLRGFRGHLNASNRGQLNASNKPTTGNNPTPAIPQLKSPAALRGPNKLGVCSHIHTKNGHLCCVVTSVRGGM